MDTSAVPANDVRRGVPGHVRVHGSSLPHRQAYQTAVLGSRFVCIHTTPIPTVLSFSFRFVLEFDLYDHLSLAAVC